MSAAWRPGSEDRGALLLVVLLPLLVALPTLTGFLQSDPMLYTAAMAVDFVGGVQPGVPYIDPNNGYQTQALGRHAAWQWIHGQVPWWNYYSGVGLPLAAEYQPGAFFPLTMLLLLPNAMAWMQVSLQVLAGLGTYGLLRQVGLSPLAALTGGLLYAFNGSLAWFSHGPAQPIPFLPWMLWGIERARVFATEGERGGWKTIAVAMAMSLLAGFPETAFIGGLLAFAWAVLRGLQVHGASRLPYAGRIALGGTVGIALAAPQVVPFFQFLLEAHVGGHGAEFANAALHPVGFIQSVVAPYFSGPIFGLAGPDWFFWQIWGGIGGYVTLPLVVAAAYGLTKRRDALAWLLLTWLLLTVPRTFGWLGLSHFWNLVPGISHTAFSRYVPPSWELAFVILAAFGVDALQREVRLRQGRLVLPTLVFVVAMAGALYLAVQAWPHLQMRSAMRNWAVGSLAWAALFSVALLALLRASPGAGRARAVAALLVAEAVVMVFIPTLSAPRRGSADIPAIHFLRDNLGLQRFFTLGPIQPNYGAYFRIASINHNYLPVSRRWTEWAKANLDGALDPVVFNGARGSPPTSIDELRRNIAAYQWAGVKYVVAFPHQRPLEGIEGAREVYRDSIMAIFELPGAKPYFESLQGDCSARPESRARVEVTCASAGTLLRRELYFAGWRASVNGREVPIAEHAKLFQSIEIPAGRSEVRFDYAPPHVGWSWGAALVAALVLLAGSVGRKRRRFG